MSDELQDTFAGATRGLFGAIGFILLLVGSDMIAERDGVRFGFGIALALCGAVCFYGAFIKKHAQRVFSKEQITQLNLAAKDPRWWLATALLLCAAVIFSPFLTPSRLPFVAPSGPIVWNFEDNAKGLGYFLNMMETQGHELRVLGFQAHGKNITDNPIQHLTGYMRSDLTNAQIPIYLQAQEPDASKIQACFPHPWIPTAPEETYGIPAFAEFDVGTYEKPSVEINLTEGVKDGVAVPDFRTAFVPFTVVMEYDGGKIQRRFSRDEIEKQFLVFEKTSEKTFNPISNPHVQRRPSARPITLPPLHPIMPLATPVAPSDNVPTGAIPPKD